MLIANSMKKEKLFDMKEEGQGRLIIVVKERCKVAIS